MKNVLKLKCAHPSGSERRRMNNSWCILQLRQIPPSSLPFRRYKGLNFVPPRIYCPAVCFSKRIQTNAYEIVDGSCVPTADTAQATKIKDKVAVPQESVGAFQKLPMVMPSVDILYSALRKAKRISATKGIANVAKRERNRAAKQLDALMKELAVPLRTYKECFPNKNILHPYERSLIELTLGDGNYDEVLGKVDTLRKKVVSVGKEHASLCAKSISKREAEERLSEGRKKIEEIFNCEGKAVDELLNIAKTLRAMPVIDLEIPTLCLVGAPNVGKSSLVRLLSTGKPEVCNYPFTTRGVLMGHITLSYQNFQVTDTPGLLRRHDEDRNNLEKLTLAVLSHLPTAVLYVHDLSGECGISPSDQFLIYKEIKERFSDHLWLDVVSKCDLLRGYPAIFITEDSDADNLELSRYRKVGPDGALHVSVTTKVGIHELERRVHELLVSQSERIKSLKNNQDFNFVRFCVAWPELMSPCIWENASIVLQLGFLGLLLFHFIKNKVDSLRRGRKKVSGVENYPKDVRYGFSYKLSVICSVIMLGIHCVAVLMLKSKTRAQCELRVPVLTSRILQIVSWAITLTVLYKIRDRMYLQFPWILRFWWTSSFLLCLARAMIDAHGIIAYKDHLRLQEYADIFGFLASVCLLGVSISGKTGIRFSVLGDISDPLLDKKSEKQSDEKKDSPYGNASIIQLVTFSWLNPLFETGIKKPLDQDEVPNVDIKDSAGYLSQDFDECLEYTKKSDRTAAPSVYKTIYIFARKKAAINALFAITNAGASYVGPYLINDFVSFLSNKNSRSIESGYLLALGFLGAKVVETIAQRQWIFGARQLGLRLRAALISHIYKKGLILSSQSRQSCSSGEIINYMSVDVQRITDFIWYLNNLWMLPVQISAAIFILHTNLEMGALVALAATLSVMAGNIPLTRIQKTYQTKIMEAKDDRMKSTSEVLRNMKTLKLQAWDSHYLQKLVNLRKIEHNWIWKSLRLSALSAFIFWGSPAFISVITFGGCVLMGIPLTAGSILSALATFRMLQDPIFNLPDLLNAIAQGKVSVDRIASYLQEDEIQSDAVKFVPSNDTDYHVEIDQGKFSWDADSIIPTLDHIQLKVKKGMKVAICGTVGSGKSSLLSCVLGEMQKLSGVVKISGSKAYVPQSPWILTGNIRENILFGKPYESFKYERTIEACALVKDFELFAAGDLTEIGERGINMSGGQKQRIQIARAVYQDADIYLLDDPFSAVDAHTGSELFQDCLMGILRDKTILYVTHQVEFLPAADLILVMQNGKIAQMGTFVELLKQNIGFEVLVGAHSQAIESVLAVESSSRTSESVAVHNETDTETNTNQEFPHTKQESEHNLSVEITEKEGRLVQDEEREKGSIGKEVYLSYLTTVKGGALVPVILLAQTSFQVLQIASNYWMAWACPTGEDKPATGMHFVLLVYTLLAVVSSLCVLVRASLVAVSGLHTSEKLFSNMLNSILRAPMSFFDSTPAGRILNRASTDQSVLDLEMANKLGWCAFSVIQLLGTIGVMSQVAWEVFVIFIPVTAICIWYQQYYIPTARELARLAGIQRAPILHHFAESLSGAASIRAFDQQERFIGANIWLIDNHSRPWFHNVSAMEWLSFRLNQLSNFVFAFSLVLLVTLPEGIINPSIAGLAVTYGINLNVLQASVIWNICNAENKMISVERILQYSSIASESPLVIEDSKPPANWPDIGEICFKNLQIRYAEHLPSVLKNITCTFPGRKKIGVVGRTGSGKSTLIQALFRIVEPREGIIIIDGVDISKTGLHDLRSRLSIIPQDPTMFEGTVRGNLDPLENYADNEVWQALDKCQLGGIVRQKPDKLESTVIENGENWSMGQRQLFCLGRLLFKKSSILVLDEATASVDSATDGVIQKIVSQEFKDRTVVTIAHRIHTVIDSDLVLVLSDGRIAEYDTPAKLLERENSFFSKLIKEYSMRSQSFNSVQSE